MTGLRLILGPAGALLDTTSRVSGFNAVVQNAMVTIGTAKGSDAVFPEKGTGLLIAAVRGVMVDRAAAVHLSNFAAVDALFFSRTYDPSPTVEKLAAVKLTPVVFDGKLLHLSAQFTSGSGVTEGVTGTLQ